MFRDLRFSKSSLRVSTPRYLWRRCSLSKCAWQWEQNGKFDIPVNSLPLEDTTWYTVHWFLPFHCTIQRCSKCSQRRPEGMESVLTEPSTSVHVLASPPQTAQLSKRLSDSIRPSQPTGCTQNIHRRYLRPLLNFVLHVCEDNWPQKLVFTCPDGVVLHVYFVA